jgi:hypothetical protein
LLAAVKYIGAGVVIADSGLKYIGAGVVMADSGLTLFY